MSTVTEAARAMQRLSAVSRWGGKTDEQKRAAMSALAKARWAKHKRSKTKARGLRQNIGLGDK